MNRIANSRTNGLLALVSLVWLAISTAACLSGQIIVDASDGAALAGVSALRVSFSGTAASAETPSPSPTSMTALQARAESDLRAKGYSIATDDDVPILEIALHTEQVERRTWTSDPDASASKLVERTEAVVSLRARDGNGELWFCDAHAVLPKPGMPFAPKLDDVWAQLLERALAKVPVRPKS